MQGYGVGGMVFIALMGGGGIWGDGGWGGIEMGAMLFRFSESNV